MTKIPVDKGLSENRPGSDSSLSLVPIQRNESEQFGMRLKEVIGDEPVASFARKCGVSDSLLGSYIRGEKSPGMDRLFSIAQTGGVLIDWLVTGRAPKTRAEYRALHQPPADPSAYDGRKDILEAALRVMEYKIKHSMVDDKVISAGLSSAPAWLDAAQDYPDLEVRLRSALATLEFIKVAGPIPSEPTNQ